MENVAEKNGKVSEMPKFVLLRADIRNDIVTLLGGLPVPAVSVLGDNVRWAVKALSESPEATIRQDEQPAINRPDVTKKKAKG